jgi:hypothetical protein
VLVGLTLLGATFAGPSLAGGANVNRGKPSDQVQTAWVELGAGRTVVVRAITEATTCPKVRVDGAGKSMRVRAAPSSPDYPVLTCERTVDADAMQISVAGRKLRSAPRRARRIAVVGDAGCRLAGPTHSQACNDPDQWPFEQVADSVAEYHPQLIVHVGDYLYREQPCPAGNAGCAGSPHGNNWPTWDADFFTPAAAALGAAPWIFMRGNHESCSRAGAGWFRFLDPRPVPPACGDFTAPYAVRVGGGMRMVVMDSSSASDFAPFNPEQFAPQFAALPQLAGKKAWLLSHRPLWGLAATSMGASFAITNTSLEMASNNALPSQVRLVLSGHLHNAEVFGFTGGRVPQIVAGNSGTQLDAQITAPVVGTDVAGETITDAEVLSRFGFTTFVKRSRGWALRLRDVDGKVMVRCRLRGKSTRCETA